MSGDFDGRKRDIDDISVPYAFLICSSCFKGETSTAVLEHYSTMDKSFLFEQDRFGLYPIHGLLTIHRYRVDVGDYASRKYFHDYLIRTILRLAPECARLKHKGLLPLHIVADPQKRTYEDEDRLSIVQAV